jgi:hypothetical protein
MIFKRFFLDVGPIIWSGIALSRSWSSPTCHKRLTPSTKSPSRAGLRCLAYASTNLITSLALSTNNLESSSPVSWTVSFSSHRIEFTASWSSSLIGCLRVFLLLGMNRRRQRMRTKHIEMIADLILDNWSAISLV